MVADAYSLRSSTNTSPGRSRHAAKRSGRSRRPRAAGCRGRDDDVGVDVVDEQRARPRRPDLGHSAALGSAIAPATAEAATVAGLARWERRPGPDGTRSSGSSRRGTASAEALATRVEAHRAARLPPRRTRPRRNTSSSPSPLSLPPSHYCVRHETACTPSATLPAAETGRGCAEVRSGLFVQDPMMRTWIGIPRIACPGRGHVAQGALGVGGAGGGTRSRTETTSRGSSQ